MQDVDGYRSWFRKSARVLLAIVVTNVPYGPLVAVPLYILCWVTSVDADTVQFSTIAPPLSPATSAALKPVGASDGLSIGIALASVLLPDS